MYNLIEYSDNYSKTSGSLSQYYRNESALNNATLLDNFPRNSALLKFKQKTTGSRKNDGTKAVQVIVLLNYLSNFWRSLEIQLTNCEINLILTWSTSCVLSNAAPNQEKTFAITDANLPVGTLSTQGNVKLL